MRRKKKCKRGAKGEENEVKRKWGICKRGRKEMSSQEEKKEVKEIRRDVKKQEHSEGG